MTILNPPKIRNNILTIIFNASISREKRIELRILEMSMLPAGLANQARQRQMCGLLLLASLGSTMDI